MTEKDTENICDQVMKSRVSHFKETELRTFP